MTRMDPERRKKGGHYEKKKVSGEFALMATGYNIARAENMFTFDKLMALVGA